MNMSSFICVGGILTTLAVIFQSAPVFLPAIGLFLSPLSTIPIAIAAFSNIFLGIAVFLSSVLILTMISIQESIILLFTTGVLGVVIGSLLFRRGIISSILFSSVALSLGITFLTYIVGIPGFVDLANSFSTTLAFLIFFLFSLIYSSICNICIKKFINYLTKIKIIS
ncbi:MAG: hypothetical protein E6356_12490 [Terrisporobacter othiniensis]|uniref:hypothetical protein n=1 Tax=Terrisporobacter petrolearius TaxID=1460447 RepID=UPI0022E3D1A8|nr:hypothetical protein [Terrisporobacter petrolearius]MDU4862035.1 hypothetical protein [Terrisporobacter othiniensis]MDU6995671.1 hypothetical protein [Terrisporobacter othiniensis]